MKPLNPTLRLLGASVARTVNLNRGSDPTLIADIRALIDQIEIARPISITLDSDRFSEKKLSRKQKLNVFRVVQEQLGNIAKFSGATAAKIGLRIADRKIFLYIHDNGRPVDPSLKEKGICVADILGCAEMNDGQAVLEITPAAGSILRVEFSYEEQLTATIPVFRGLFAYRSPFRRPAGRDRPSRGPARA